MTPATVFLRVLFMLLTACSLQVAQAQAFRNLTGIEGASMSNAKGVVQDRQGFMWFATYAGLFRYDSHTLKQYLQSSTDSNSISSDMLSAVFCDSRGDIWIGSSGGLDRYNRKTDNFTHIDHNLPGTNPERNNQIYFISEDRDHNILVGTPFGLNRIKTTNGKTEVTYILHRVFQGPTQDIASVSQTADGAFWAGSLNGLVHVPAKGSKPRLFRINSANKSPLLNQFMTQYLDKDNVIWLGPGSGGIVQFDIASETFRPVTDFVDPDGNLPVVSSIVSDGKGKLWMATHSGLALFDPVTRKAVWYRNQPGNIYSLADNRIQTMCLDRQGGIWLGTYYFGISNFYPDAPRFLPWPFTVNGIADVRYANAWMGTSKDGTLWVIGKDQKNLLFFDSDGETAQSYGLRLKSSTDYYRFYVDGDDMLWAAGNSVLTCYNLKTHSYRDYPTAIHGQDELEDGRVHDILEDSRGRFWLIGTFGALQFDKQTGQFKKYRSVSYAHSILEDSKNNIWIGGGDEAFLLTANENDFKRLATDKSRGAGNFASVWKLAEDKIGRIWAVTRQGLQLYDKKQSSFRLDARVSLSKIEDIQIDHNGYLWLATEAALTRYHPDKMTLQTYGYQDGLPFNGISRPASSVQLDGGELYFTTNKGIFQFSPDHVKGRNTSSPVVFTALKLSDHFVKVGDDTGLLSKALDQTQEITLSHDQNIFSVDFALLSFPRSERNRYAYKLEGFDQEWTYTGRQSATYMNLPPGSYSLVVRAANGDGYWMKTTRQLHIRILPPWWQSWYAYTAYLLIAAGSVFLVTRFLWLRTTLKKENEFYQAKLDFFTNISHEIRTHLSLIIGPLEKAYASVLENTASKNHLSYARNNSAKLMQLVDELLDFRKIQNGSVKIQVHEYDLVKILKNVLSSFEHLAAEKGIETSFNYPDQLQTVWFDLIQMQKVFYNLLSNAYKFTPETGHVSVEITCHQNQVFVSVTNNGPGIEKRHLEHLFTNFFQVAASNAQNGYGIGLALAKQIVDLHKGGLSVESQQPTASNDGQTTFRVRLQAGKEHYAQHQIGKGLPMVSLVAAGSADEIVREQNAITVKSQTVLLIEDNDELRSFERDLLAEHYNVLEAANGAEGLKMAFEHLPDLILCDVMMPELSGVQVCEKVKADLRTCHIPVILLTARTALPQVLEGLQAGADDYLVKPFDPTVLGIKISNAIQVREQLRRYYNRSLALPDVELQVVHSQDSELISKLRDLVLDNLADADFGVQQMSVQVGMSVSVLYRKLRALTGTTINDFVKTIRMQRALQLVESGNYQVSEVAMQVGFEDVKYFSKEFRKVHGKTPSQFKGQANKQISSD